MFHYPQIPQRTWERMHIAYKNSDPNYFEGGVFPQSSFRLAYVKDQPFAYSRILGRVLTVCAPGVLEGGDGVWVIDLERCNELPSKCFTAIAEEHAEQKPFINALVVYTGEYYLKCCISPYHSVPGAVLISHPNICAGRVGWGNDEEGSYNDRRAYLMQSFWNTLKVILDHDVAVLSTPMSGYWSQFLKSVDEWTDSGYIMNGNSGNKITFGMAPLGGQ